MTGRTERSEGHEGMPIRLSMTGENGRRPGTDGPCGANGGKAE
jgi:hypothetical protein